MCLKPCTAWLMFRDKGVIQYMDNWYDIMKYIVFYLSTKYDVVNYFAFSMMYI